MGGQRLQNCGRGYHLLSAPPRISLDMFVFTDFLNQSVTEQDSPGYSKTPLHCLNGVFWTSKLTMYQRLFEHSSKQTVQINGDSVNFDLRLLGRPCNVYLDCINLDAHVPLFLTHPNVRTHIVHLDTTLPSKWTL